MFIADQFDLENYYEWQPTFTLAWVRSVAMSIELTCDNWRAWINL